jgi:tetratricopeptide (TPR) repeat protein
MLSDHLRNNYLQLGVLACQAGQLEQASRFLQAGIQECERLNLKDLRSAGLLYNLAVVHRKNGQHKQAEESLLRSLRLCRRLVDADHPAQLRVLRALAACYYENGQLDLAASYYRQIMKSVKLPATEQVHYLLRLCAIENAAARHDRVKKLCSRVYAIQNSELPGARLSGSRQFAGSGILLSLT